MEVWISTLCRGIKEAHTYLSMLVFVPMGLGMFMVFSPAGRRGMVEARAGGRPAIALEAGMEGATFDASSLVWLGLGTLTLAGMAVAAAAVRLERDDVVYGG